MTIEDVKKATLADVNALLSLADKKLAVNSKYVPPVPFGQADLDDLKERLCKEVFPARDAKILEAIEEAAEQEYSIEGIEILGDISSDFFQGGPLALVTEGVSEVVTDEYKQIRARYGNAAAEEYMEGIYGWGHKDLILNVHPPKYYEKEDFITDKNDLIADLRSKLTNIDV